ncbi:cytochrome P450 76A2-like [Nicotiana tabacum]|uniref:Cytochrome P450 76A2-like n=1 Tax=Nicotiana tabacum TaxID=4097 RepID=A0A1S3Z4P0_TOBAC
MDWNWDYVFWSITSILIPLLLLLHFHRRRSNKNRRLLPPGPQGWPVFGNMFELGNEPHKTLMSLKQKYGSVVWLKLGSINTMVILSAEAAAEFFKNHDVAFAERSVTDVMKSHGYHKGSLALAPYGTYWRIMKRIMTVQMLVNKRINETVDIRRKCIDDLTEWINNEGRINSSGGIHVAKFIFLASFNMLGKLLLSRELVDPKSEKGSEFFTAMVELMECSGHQNIVDVFPWLRWIDPQGLRKKMDRGLGKTIEIVSGFLNERFEELERTGEKKKDFLEVLLEYEGKGKDEPEKLSDQELILIILEIFLAGSETTSSSIEWAMTELLSNPEAMDKVKAELTEVLGNTNKKFEETNIDNHKYLQAVVKETLRLHPPIPFLVPRKAIQETEFLGYNIPKDTQVFVNVWAIGRDPECWKDPFDFKPERFLDLKTEYRGQNFEFIPFGAGRRICAGIPLAHRMLHLLLGSLLHEFDWEIDNSLLDEVLDTQDRMGVTVRKLKPLKAIPKRKNKTL